MNENKQEEMESFPSVKWGLNQKNGCWWEINGTSTGSFALSYELR
jgi:hypothetical protein